MKQMAFYDLFLPVVLYLFRCVFSYEFNDTDISEWHNAQLDAPYYDDSEWHNAQLDAPYYNDTPFVLPKFPLSKCHCTANHIWEHGQCLSMVTRVAFVVHAWPPVMTKEIDTSDFDEILIDKPKCNSSAVSVTIKDVAFVNTTLYHFDSGEVFDHLYCVEHVRDSKGGVIVEASVCLQNINIPVCCPPHHYLNPSNYNCDKDETTNTFHPPINLGNSLINSTNFGTYLQKLPNCNAKHFVRKTLTSDPNSTLLQYQNSRAIFLDWNTEYGFPTAKLPEDYCVALENHGNTLLYTAIYLDEEDTLHCTSSFNSSSPYLDAEEEQCDRIMTWLLLPLLTLSAIFLLIILVLHAAMPELRKSLGSKITICHVASLFCGFCILILLHIPYQFNCKIIGPLVQVCFLSTFFWLNVMCFDIWWKLRCRTPAAETPQSARMQFWRYSLYAWGIPFLIGVITVAMDNIPAIQNVPGLILPGFGKKHCWFVDRSASLVYYFLIIGLLMLANLFFFLWVFVIIFRANCTYRKVLSNGNNKKNKNSPSRTWIYLKIFGVMGITWICEILSWQEGTCKYWAFMDVINALRGLILFIIFFANVKSIRKIRQRFSSMNVSLQSQMSRSVNSLRKFRIRRPSGVVGTDETNIHDSRRSSETHTDVSNRTTTNQETENV